MDLKSVKFPPDQNDFTVSGVVVRICEALWNQPEASIITSAIGDTQRLLQPDP